MPRVPDQLQQAVVFLYPDVESAQSGARAGGTGFLVSVGGQTFLVTNTHVAAGGCRTARVGGTDPQIVDLANSDWRYHPDGDDIACVQFDALGPGLVWSDFAPTTERMVELNIGVGDEVIMLGRFVAHDGGQRNAPLARFGSIAMMPGEAVRDGRGLLVEAYLVEMRSLSGFSGSPVFVYLGPGTYRGDGRMMPFYSETIGLLGIDTGHIQMVASVINQAGETMTDLRVQQNTGIAVVAPTSRIASLLFEE